MGEQESEDDILMLDPETGEKEVLEDKRAPVEYSSHSVSVPARASGGTVDTPAPSIREPGRASSP